MVKQRKILLTATIVYTIIALYFMFFAFCRGEASEQISSYTFIFMPENFISLPSPADLLHPSLMSMVAFGNTITIIPFGILIPWLYRVSFVRFITLFFSAILVLETIQALYNPGQLRYQRRPSEFDGSSPRFWGVQAWFPLPEPRAQSGGNGYIGYSSFYSFMGIRCDGKKQLKKRGLLWRSLNARTTRANHPPETNRTVFKSTDRRYRSAITYMALKAEIPERSRTSLRDRRFSPSITDTPNQRIIPVVSVLLGMAGRS